MSYGDQREHERNDISEQLFGLENVRANTLGHPDEEPGMSATLSDPTQPREQAHVRSYVPEIERLIELYWTGERTRFELVASITQFLNNDRNLSSWEKSQSFDLYVSEIDAVGTSERNKGKKKEGSRAGGADQLSHFVATEGCRHDDGGSSPECPSSSSESDDERDKEVKKTLTIRHAMAWTSRSPGSNPEP
jgi:hypothetical protein